MSIQEHHEEEPLAVVAPDEDETERSRRSALSVKHLKCLLLSEKEWKGLLQGGILLRPYSCKEDLLGAVVKTKRGQYEVVGKLEVERILLATSMNNREIAFQSQGVYTRLEIGNWKDRTKKLFLWQLKGAHPFPCDERIELPFLDSKCRNRPFSVDVEAAAKEQRRASVGPVKLCLEDTADFFLGRWPTEQQELFLDRMRSLHGKQLRIGTTCSGTDVVVTVLKQTLQHFLKKQVGGPKARSNTYSHARIIYIYVCRLENIYAYYIYTHIHMREFLYIPVVKINQATKTEKNVVGFLCVGDLL